MADRKVTYIIELRDRATRNLKKVNKAFMATEKSSLNLNSAIGRLVGTLGAAALGKKILQLGMNMEQTRVAFGTFLGSVEKGNALIKELNEFANVTPFDNEQVIKSGKVLLAAGITAEKMGETLKAVGDVASGATVPLTEMAAIYAKAMNKGRVQAEELNQLAERGVPILQTFADMYGITKEEVMKLGSQGKLTSDQLALAFQKMTGEGGMFFNMMEKQSETAAGKFSTVLGKLQMEGIELGEKTLPAITEALTFVIDNFDTITKIVKIAAKAFILYKAGVIGAKVATRAMMMANKLLRISYVALNRGIKGAARSLKVFKASMISTGIGALVVAIGFAVEKLIQWRQKTKEQKAAQDELNESLQETTDIMGRQAYLDWMKSIDATEKRLVDVGGRLVEVMEMKPASDVLGHLMDDVSRLPEETLRNMSMFLEETIVRTQRAMKDLAKEENPLFAGTQQKNLEEYQAQLAVVMKELERIDKIREKAQTKKTIIGMEPDKKAKDQMATITGAAPKTFNINVEKLIENFEINTQNLTESAAEVRKTVTMAIAEALADVQPISD